MNQLPISRIVNVAVNLSPAGAQSQSLSDLLILGTSTVIDPTERMRTYASLSAVATDFGTSAEEYLAAQAWFAQLPQPTQIRVGRWAKTAAAGGLRCAPLTVAQQALSVWNAISAGKFSVSINGAAASDIGPLNFSAAANLNAVASTISAALTDATCVWNATYSRFEFASTTTGSTSSVGYLAAPTTGTDISGDLLGRSTDSGAYTYAGIAAEALDACMGVFDDRFGGLWYGVMAPAGSTSDKMLGAAYIEAASNKHVFGCTTQEAAALLSTDTTSLPYQLSQAKYKRTICQYSSTSAYAVASFLGRALTTNWGAASSTQTMKFKVEPGVGYETLSTSQAAALEGKNGNVFVEYANGVAIIEQGVMADGTFVDVILGTDWLALAIQTAMFNALYQSNKIPQTDDGVAVLQTAIEGQCSQAVLNGLLAPGVWNSNGFGQLAQGDYLAKGYYVYAPPIATQSAADRGARKAPPFQVAAKLAGAIHSASVTINVNQ